MSEDTPPEKLKEFVRDERIRAFAEALMQESERGCVIVGASFLEALLEDLLHDLCRDDKESIKLIEGWSFFTKIRAAFAFRLISKKLKQQLDLIREIRNDFAHSAGPVSFQAPKVRDHLRVLMDNFKVQPLVGPALAPRLDDLAKTHPEHRDRLAFVVVIVNAAGQMQYIRGQVVSGVYPPHDVGDVLRGPNKSKPQNS